MFTFLVCHLIGISSACTNPFLYGMLNNNFLNEFTAFWDKIKLCGSWFKSSWSVLMKCLCLNRNHESVEDTDIELNECRNT